MTAYDGNVAITGAWLHNSQAASVVVDSRNPGGSFARRLLVSVLGNLW